MTEIPDLPPPDDPEPETFRKLLRSAVVVLSLMACAALLLALGQCAGAR